MCIGSGTEIKRGSPEGDWSVVVCIFIEYMGKYG